MAELTYERYQSRKPKPGPTAKARAKRRRAERPVVKSVRAQCVERDGYCRLAALSPCNGPSEWAHLGAKKRARTRGMLPEERHTKAGSFMACRRHHQLYDAGLIEIAVIPESYGPLPYGADAPMRTQDSSQVVIV